MVIARETFSGMALDEDFGRGTNNVVKRLKKIEAEVRYLIVRSL